MKLVDNWGKVLARSWSMYGIYAIAIIGALEANFSLFSGVIPQKYFAIATTVIAAVAGVARLIPQKSVSGDKQ